MKRVLITGASGFLGNSIASRAVLNPDWEVYGLTSGRRKVILPRGVKEVSANLFDTDVAKNIINDIKPEIMVHLAWNLENKDFLKTAMNIKCLEMSFNLLRAFAENGGSRLIFSGSSAEYGYEQNVCRETDVCNPSDLYGRCKLSFTETAKLFCKMNNIEYVTARYFSIYGVGEKHTVHVVPLCIKTMMHGEKFECKAPKNVWDYVYIDDAGEATVKIMNSHYVGIVNVGTGIATEMCDVFQTIADELGRIDLLSFLEQHENGKRSIANTDILRSEIGYSCTTSLGDGIRKTIEWMKQEDMRK